MEAAYTALLTALAGAVGTIAALARAESKRRTKLETDMNSAFKKIRRLEIKAGLRTPDADDAPDAIITTSRSEQ